MIDSALGGRVMHVLTSTITSWLYTFSGLVQGHFFIPDVEATLLQIHLAAILFEEVEPENAVVCDVSDPHIHSTLECAYSDSKMPFLVD